MKLNRLTKRYLSELERHLKSDDSRIFVNLFNTGFVVDLKSVVLKGIKLLNDGKVTDHATVNKKDDRRK